MKRKKNLFSSSNTKVYTPTHPALKMITHESKTYDF